MKHTDTPFRLEVFSDGSNNIFGSDGYVCDCANDERGRADAELIIKAVNSHYPMIEALESMLIMFAKRGSDAFLPEEDQPRPVRVAMQALAVAKST